MKCSTLPGAENPKSTKMYENNVHLVEKVSEIIYFIAINIGVPGFLLPKLIVSYFVYFTTDSGRDAFELPFDMWYAIKRTITVWFFTCSSIFH